MPSTDRISSPPTFANGCSTTAKRLGYVGPDPVARSLRTRKAGAVGLVMTEPLTYFFSDPAARDFVAGVAQSCEEMGQGLLLVAVGPSRSLEDGTAAVLGAGVDGFVVYSVREDDPYLQVVLQRRVARCRGRPAQRSLRSVPGGY